MTTKETTTSRPSLQLALRSATGKGPNLRLRATGVVPAVVYTKGKDAVTVQADPKAVVAILQGPLGRNSAIDLQIAGEKTTRLAVIKEFQIHPVKRTIEHLDFWEITPETMLTVAVPFAGEGRSDSEKQGGRTRITRDDIMIRAKPGDVPAKVSFDLTKLAYGDHNITIGQIPLPSGVTAVYKNDYSLIQIFTTKSAEEKAEEAEKAAKKDDKKAAPAAAKAGAAPAAAAKKK